MSATSVAVSIGPSSLMAMDPMWSLPLSVRVGCRPHPRGGQGWGAMTGGAYGCAGTVAKPYFGAELLVPRGSRVHPGRCPPWRCRFPRAGHDREPQSQPALIGRVE